jgi:hypothetical protein
MLRVHYLHTHLQVESIINKKNLKDPENQVIEDALCLGEQG